MKLSREEVYGLMDIDDGLDFQPTSEIVAALVRVVCVLSEKVDEPDLADLVAVARALNRHTPKVYCEKFDSLSLLEALRIKLPPVAHQ